MSEITFYGVLYSMSAYGKISELRNDVWNDVFLHCDKTMVTDLAVKQANHCQKVAEYNWHKYWSKS